MCDTGTVSEFRYPQFCPFARAAEVLGQRWTILILRNLAGGPQRFSDLRRGLRGISPSVLSDRLDALEARRLVRRRFLPPPASCHVYELGEAGLALTPAMIELARWGFRFLEPPEPGDQIEAVWLRTALAVFARREPTPALSVQLEIAAEPEPLALALDAGDSGVRIAPGRLASPDLQVSADPAVVLGLLLRHFTAREAMADGRLVAEGDPLVVERLPDLFDLPAAPRARGAAAESRPSTNTQGTESVPPKEST